VSLYDFAKGVFYFIFAYLARWKVSGRENMPSKGPVVVVSNHISLWDPIAVGVALNRQVYFMAKEELFRYPVFGRILLRLGAFPVKRGQIDRAAIKNSMEVLRKGNVLGIFPEGHRSDSGKLEQFTEGAVHLAVKFNAYILPVGVAGTKGMFRRGWFHPFSVNIGNPVLAKNTGSLSPSEFAAELNERIREEVGKLAGLELNK
jgi:1-acyl-sn-glycerol-3-phosphate acyltransferase